MNALWSSTPLRPAASDLQGYLAGATLTKLYLAPSTPPLPPTGHKSHRINLAVEPNRRRRLEQIHRFEPRYFKEDIENFISKYIPAEDLDHDDIDLDTGDRIVIPCKGFSIHTIEPLSLTCFDELGASWISLVFRTIQRIIQMVPAFASARGWSMQVPLEMQGEDYSMFRYLCWKQVGREPSEFSTDPCSLIIAYQPPWILSPQDMKQFVSNTAMPPCNMFTLNKQQRYNGAQRVWAKLWDVCKSKGCPWFILTTYSHWVFGCFSRGWTRGFTTQIISFDSTGPTVLQCVLYWVLSSMRLPDVEGQFIPEVPELVEHLCSTTPVPNSTRLVTPGLHTESSSWCSILQEEPGDNPVIDDVECVSPPPYLQPFLPGLCEPLTKDDGSRDRVELWLRYLSTPEPLGVPQIPERPSPAPSNWSGDTISGEWGVGGIISNVPPAGPDDTFS